MITIVKPIPYLHTTAKNETAYTKILQTSIMNMGKGKTRQHPYRVPPISCLASLCRTSISIMAASRYLCMERTIFIATTSFFSLSKHSKTCPKVPEEKPMDYGKRMVQFITIVRLPICEYDDVQPLCVAIFPMKIRKTLF